MCQKCADLKIEFVDSGKMTDDEFMYWLWNETPFPVGEPLEDQIQELKKHYEMR